MLECSTDLDSKLSIKNFLQGIAFGGSGIALSGVGAAAFLVNQLSIGLLSALTLTLPFHKPMGELQQRVVNIYQEINLKPTNNPIEHWGLASLSKKVIYLFALYGICEASARLQRTCSYAGGRFLEISKNRFQESHFYTRKSAESNSVNNFYL